MNRVLNHTFLRLFFLLALGLFSIPSAFATTIIMPTDDSMVIGSRAIIRGRVLAVESAYDNQSNRIYTYVTIRVQEVFKGEIRERKIVLKQEGGQVADRGSRIYGTPKFTLDENVILYLDTWADGAFRVHQMFLGKFNIVDDANTGQQFAVRSQMDEGVVVLQNHEPHASGEITNGLELSAYKAMLRGKIVENVEPSLALEQKYYSGIPKLARPVEYKDLVSKGKVQPQWTYIHSAHPRWFEPDTGQPVVFRINPAGAPNAQITTDIVAAMNAWSSIPGCALRLTTGANTEACGPDTSLNSIIFNGCDGRWSPGGGCQGVLALGGLSWGGGVSGTIVINGVTFIRGHSGFVSFNPYAACNFGISCNVQEITTHELGHALGLGHSADNTATMAAFAHFDGRCASLRADDIAGAVFIYPGQGGGGGPLSITSSSPLPNGSVGVAYSQAILATGGTLPYTWSVIAGSLPAGVTLNAQSGILSGSPTAAGTANFTLQVRDAAQVTAQKPFAMTINTAPSGPYDAQFVSQTVPTAVQPGQTFQVNMKFNNTGTQAWVDGITTNFYIVSQNPPLNQTWGGNGVPLSAFPIQPGQQLDINFSVIAPVTAGNYNFQWQMYQNGGIGFFGQMSPNVVIQVGSAPPLVNNAEFVSQTVPTTMTAGQSTSISVVMRNSGTTTWTAGTYKLGSQNPQDNTTWGLNRVNLGSSVAPGSNATFTFNVTAPLASGTYNCQWSMNDGSSFFGATSTNVAVAVSGGFTKLTGANFGTSPAFVAGREADKAYDGNTSTFFDYLNANGGYTGIDLGAGNARRVVRVRYYARSDWAGGPARMVGGKFQGSSTSTTSGFVDLWSVTTTPPLGAWVEVTITDPTAYRYLRYLSPDGGFCNIAEIEFYTDGTTPQRFLDVPPTHPYYVYIERIAQLNVTLGCTTTTYCPDGIVTRAEMAVFIERAIGVFTPPTPGSQTFTDVPPSYWAYSFIGDFANRGITLGCTTTTYCPGDFVTREQMAVFMERAVGRPNPPPPSSQRFVDVPPSQWSYAFVESFVANGLGEGILDVIKRDCNSDGVHFCPSRSLTRAEMAAWLVIAFNL